MTKTARIYIVIVALFWPQAAIADDAYRNALHHAGRALAIESLCPALRSNTDRIGAMLVINGGGRAYDDLLRDVKAAAATAAGDLADLDRTALCLSGLMLYGPGGTNVDGLVVAR